MTETLLVACPHCATKNRVPQDKLSDGGKCGHCKQALFTGEPIDLTTANFHAHASSDLPLVVDFWAAWCQPCRQFMPVIQQAARNLEPALRFGKLNVDAEAALAEPFGVRDIPTLVLLRQGKEVARSTGVLSPTQLGNWLKQHGIGR